MMSIPALNLDDRKFTDLVDELRRLIPRYAPGWTDHNVSDPGIMLIELFAWLTEALLYRLNRVPEASRVRLLELLGAVFQPAQPAIVKLTVTADGLSAPYTLPRGSQILAKPEARSSGIPLETLHALTFTPVAPQQIVLARQTVPFVEAIQQRGNGAPYQLVALAHTFLALPKAPFPRPPQIWVDQALWEFQPTLNDSQPDDHHFTVRPNLKMIVFGDGKHGQIPEPGAAIRISYRVALTGPDRIQHESLGVSNDPQKNWQVFRLSKPLLALDLQEPDDLEPQVWVNGQCWTYTPNFLDMLAAGPEFTVEPWHDALRFGNGAYGQLPDAGADIKLAGRATLGAQGNIPIGATFTFAEQPALAHPEAPHLALRIAETFAVVTQGCDPTGLAEARDQVFALVQPGWRAITAADVETLIPQQNGVVAHAHCRPGDDLSSAQPHNRPGQVGVVIVPQPAAQWTASLAALRTVLGFTPDGRRLLAYGDDAIVRLWDARSGEKGSVLAVALRAVALNATNSYLAAAGADQTVRIWALATGTQLPPLRYPAPVNSVAFDPSNGERLAAACADNQIRVWDMAKRTLQTFSQHTAAVNCVVYRQDGQQFASGSDDGTAIVWDATQAIPIAIVYHEAPVYGVAFSPDGRYLATAGADATVRIWHLQKQQAICRLPHDAAVFAVAFHPNPNVLLVATAAGDGSVCLWDAVQGAQLAHWRHQAAVKGIAFSPDGQCLVTASADQTVGLWDLTRLQKLATIPYAAAANAVAFSQDGQHLVTVGDDQRALLWDWGDNGQLIQAAVLPIPQTTAIFSGDGRRLATATADGSAWLWDAENGAQLALLSAQTLLVQLRFSADSRQLATVANDNMVQLWDATSGAVLPERAQPPTVHCLRFSADLQQFAIVDRAADGEHAVYLWRTHPAAVNKVLPQPGPVAALCFNQDGTRLVVRLENGQAYLWSTRQRVGQPDQPPLALGTDVALTVFSPDGQWLATAHEDQTVRCWQAKRGLLQREVKAAATVVGLGYSPTNQQLVVISAGAQGGYLLQQWDVRQHSTAALLTAALTGREALLFNRTGRWLAHVDQQLVHLWDMAAGKELSALSVAPAAAVEHWQLGLLDADTGQTRFLTIGDAAGSRPVPLLSQGEFLLGIRAEAGRSSQTFQLWPTDHVYMAADFLAERQLVTTQHHVQGPTYTPVAVKATVVRNVATQREQQVSSAVNDALTQFFHPLTGSVDGKGWPPGRAVYRSEVYQVIENVAGIDHVDTLTFTPPDVENQVTIPPHNLVQCLVDLEVV